MKLVERFYLAFKKRNYSSKGYLFKSPFPKRINREVFVITIKDSTFDVLVNYYKKNQDLKRFILVCREILDKKASTPEMRGEVCETVLYVMLSDFIEKNNLKDWRISKGLILKDIEKDRNHNYFTEVDLTLFTPKCVYSFECKCYKGEKFLSDRGTLFVKRGNDFKKSLDVFDQHFKHFKVLFNNIKCGLSKTVDDKNYKSFKLLYFDFSTERTGDKRDEKFKHLFPIINEDNLFSLFKTYAKRPDYWNMQIVNKVVDIIEKGSKKNAIKHLEYVRSLRHNNVPSKRE